MTQCLVALLLGVPWAAPAAPESGDLRLPSFTRSKLDNGLTLLLMEQHEVPIVSFSVLVDAGSVADPAGKEGLSSLTAELLRQGTKSRPANQISADLDFVGGELEFGADTDYVVGSAEFLRKDLALGLDLLADVLQHPVFPKDEFQQLLSRSIDELKRAKDLPQAVIGRYFDAALFGAHPYGRPVGGDERSLAAIRRSDVVRFWEQHYGPASTTIAVAGDFKTADMESAMQEKFGRWQAKSPRPRPALIPPERVSGRRLVLVDKPDATQTFFMIGNVGVSRTNADRVAIEAVNTAFGGRFTSILNDALRVDSGLTYGVRSRFEQGVVPGSFAIFTYTRNDATVQAIDLTLELLDRLHTNGLTDAQLKSVQAYLKGQFPPRIETTDGLARLLVQMSFYGLDERDVNEYFAKVDALTTAEVRRVIDRYFPRDDLVLVLVGKAAEIRDAVGKYAPTVKVRPISQVGFR